MRTHDVYILGTGPTPAEAEREAYAELVRVQRGFGNSGIWSAGNVHYRSSLAPINERWGVRINAVFFTVE